MLRAGDMRACVIYRDRRTNYSEIIQRVYATRAQRRRNYYYARTGKTSKLFYALTTSWKYFVVGHRRLRPREYGNNTPNGNTVFAPINLCVFPSFSEIHWLHRTVNIHRCALLNRNRSEKLGNISK